MGVCQLIEVITMERTLAVAKALYNGYASKFGKKMDEMKMHKLMYFIQRESLLNSKDVLFSDEFEGWKYGPSLTCVRTEYRYDSPFSDVTDGVSDCTKKLVDFVLDKYASMSLWKLSALSHAELSWKLSRKGLRAEEKGNRKLQLSAMKADAVREKFERKYYPE